MKRKIAQTELEGGEYSTFAATATKKGLTIKEALREAAVRWTREQLGINPKDPLFHVKPRDWGKGTENASREVDDSVYTRTKKSYFGVRVGSDHSQSRMT